MGASDAGGTAARTLRDQLTASRRATCLVGRQVAEETMRSDLTVQAGSLCYFARRPRLDLVLSNLLIRDQDNHANDVLATRDGANVRVHEGYHVPLLMSRRAYHTYRGS
jgi:hypothetical protein